MGKGGCCREVASNATANFAAMFRSRFMHTMDHRPISCRYNLASTEVDVHVRSSFVSNEIHTVLPDRKK